MKPALAHTLDPPETTPLLIFPRPCSRADQIFVIILLFYVHAHCQAFLSSCGAVIRKQPHLKGKDGGNNLSSLAF